MSRIRIASHAPRLPPASNAAEPNMSNIQSSEELP
jgi:hypothetical protein